MNRAPNPFAARVDDRHRRALEVVERLADRARRQSPRDLPRPLTLAELEAMAPPPPDDLAEAVERDEVEHAEHVAEHVEPHVARDEVETPKHWVPPVASRPARAGAPAPAVELVCADRVRLEPVRWLWPGFVPRGMLTILAGSPGAGKTTIALTLAAVVTRGGRWPDGSRCEAPGDIVVWSGEDPPAVLAARLAASGANLSRVHFVSGSNGGSFDPARDVAALEVAAARLQAPRLLIVDPIVSAVHGDSHKSAEVRRSLQPLVDLGHRLGCSVLGISHFGKSTAGRDPTERVVGSIAFAALARVVLVAARDRPPEDGGEPRRVLVRAKSNCGLDTGGFAFGLERVEVARDVEAQRVRWLEAVHGSARDVLAEVEAPDDDPESPGDVADWLRELLAESGPLPAREVRKAANDAGLSWRSVQRAMRRAGAEYVREGFGRGTFWTLRSISATSAPRFRVGADGADGGPAEVFQ